MSGIIGTVITLAIVGVGGYFLWINKDEILAGLKSGGAPQTVAATSPPPTTDTSAAATSTAGEYDSKTGTYKAPAGGYKNTGGYKGMPGWYTAAGHHHCTKGEKGCVCTDPKKCLGIRGTGSENCKGGVCAPGPGECRPDLGRYGAGPCNDCPAGTGGGKCAAGGAYAAKYARSYNARAYDTAPIDEVTYGGNTKRRLGYYDVLMDDDDNLLEYIPTMFALTNEKMSCW